MRLRMQHGAGKAGSKSRSTDVRALGKTRRSDARPMNGDASIHDHLNGATLIPCICRGAMYSGVICIETISVGSAGPSGLPDVWAAEARGNVRKVDDDHRLGRIILRSTTPNGAHVNGDDEEQAAGKCGPESWIKKSRPPRQDMTDQVASMLRKTTTTCHAPVTATHEASGTNDSPHGQWG